MSFKATACALRTACPSLASKLVLIVLADHYNHLTAACFPSQERIAAMAGMTKRTVQRAIVELEGAGLIERRKGKRRGSYNASTHYRLTFYLQARLQARQDRVNGYAASPLSPSSHGVRLSPKQGTSPPSADRASGGESAKKAKKRRSASAKPQVHMTYEWNASPKEIAYAVGKGIEEPAARLLAEQFRFWWLSVGKPRADWRATWYNWVLREVARKEADNAKAGSSGPRSRGQKRQDDLRDMHQIAMGLSAKWAEREGCG